MGQWNGWLRAHRHVSVFFIKDTTAAADCCHVDAARGATPRTGNPAADRAHETEPSRPVPNRFTLHTGLVSCCSQPTCCCGARLGWRSPRGWAWRCWRSPDEISKCISKDRLKCPLASPRDPGDRHTHAPQYGADGRVGNVKAGTNAEVANDPPSSPPPVAACAAASRGTWHRPQPRAAA